MAEWNIPDDLANRVKSHVAERGEADVGDFLSRAVEDRLAYECDAKLQAAITASIERGIADAKAGRVQDAREAMRTIAAEKSIKLDR